MYCKKCGSPVDGGAKFCVNCGTPVGTAPEAGPVRTDVPAFDPKRVTLYPDGKYRWTYEMSLFKNPTVFFLIWKIFFFIILGIFAVITVIDAVEWSGEFGGRALENLKLFGIVAGGMTALVGISYLIYAAMMGGKYIVDFEMDGYGVKHAQTPAQAKKAKKIGQAAALTGAATGNWGAVGAGINAQRTEMYSDFAKVRRVKAYPRRGLIKVNALLGRNQVYAQKDDFEFVRDFIISHCPDLKKR